MSSPPRQPSGDSGSRNATAGHTVADEANSADAFYVAAKDVPASGPSGVTSAVSSAVAVGVALGGAATADERAREYATDPRRSILLQAPAGSGKTTVLTQRLLRLLAEVDEPEEILAITFTRKSGRRNACARSEGVAW
jgi:UvrD/REP helicase N-terminal domain